MIDAHSKVTLHFSLSVSRDARPVSRDARPCVSTDALIDSTFDKQPATFVMGDGSLLPGFENRLLGLKAGDEKTFLLSASEAFGEINPDSIHVMERKQFKDLILSEGLIVSFDGAGKQPMPGVVKKIDGDKITVDFNHPLAGQVICFSVKIISVEHAVPVKINMRSA